jgi:hypothetical protein
MRQMMISEFGDWLGTQTNKHGRPFQEDTILAYCNAALALSTWLEEVGLEVDFTGCDTAVLNRFFRSYHSSHSQGGTNTKQRNLRHLFTWLEGAYGHPHPYTSGLVRFAPVKGRPSTLSADFIRDLLSVMGSGKARDFQNARLRPSQHDPQAPPCRYGSLRPRSRTPPISFSSPFPLTCPAPASLAPRPYTACRRGPARRACGPMALR